eukprot:GHVP01024040.1.p2 GENE.GHVP01024040.1~~GHVP01024040.1.p2  ORF type:complete len:207 (-),score=39.41 GHVP01024040.1:767-1387(-)
MLSLLLLISSLVAAESEVAKTGVKTPATKSSEFFCFQSYGCTIGGCYYDCEVECWEEYNSFFGVWNQYCEYETYWCDDFECYIERRWIEEDGDKATSEEPLEISEIEPVTTEEIQPSEAPEVPEAKIVSPYDLIFDDETPLRTVEAEVCGNDYNCNGITCDRSCRECKRSIFFGWEYDCEVRVKRCNNFGFCQVIQVTSLQEEAQE